MNKFTICIELETYSENPKDWIVDSIVDQLQEDEELLSINIGRWPESTEPVV